MSFAPPPEQHYPRLWELLEYRGLPFKPIFTASETGAIFGVNRRTVLKMIEVGRIVPRDLPGRGRFLAADLEEYLNNHNNRKPNRKQEGR